MTALNLRSVRPRLSARRRGDDVGEDEDALGTRKKKRKKILKSLSRTRTAPTPEAPSSTPVAEVCIEALGFAHASADFCSPLKSVLGGIGHLVLLSDVRDILPDIMKNNNIKIYLYQKMAENEELIPELLKRMHEMAISLDASTRPLNPSSSDAILFNDTKE